MMHLLIALTLAAVSPQVSGVPEALSTLADACNLGRDDGAHEAHTCPADFSESDCWWVWHCCEDSHGHRVEPFLQLLYDCRGGCTAASDEIMVRVCRPHTPVHIRNGAVADFCARFYPADLSCGSGQHQR